jgi:hypothetical protein
MNSIDTVNLDYHSLDHTVHAYGSCLGAQNTNYVPLKCKKTANIYFENV